jgi:ring-1,2-phenylacetyl-CoA epoxidase subunit PaaD
LDKFNKEYILNVLTKVKDPEIPVLSIIDLGIVRDVNLSNNLVHIIITPTYSGCPAMKVIEDDILSALKKDFTNAKVSIQLSPAWTTDWMTLNGKENLKKFGIAPPKNSGFYQIDLSNKIEDLIECPLCGSNKTELISQFSSTSCKSMYKCLECKEPFDYFKNF